MTDGVSHSKWKEGKSTGRSRSKWKDGGTSPNSAALKEEAMMAVAGKEMESTMEVMAMGVVTEEAAQGFKNKYYP